MVLGSAIQGRVEMQHLRIWIGPRKTTIYEEENLKEQEDYWKTAFFLYEVRSSHWHKASGWFHITK